MLSSGLAGEGGGAGDRPSRGSLDRHRALRLRRAKRAACHHRDGPGRDVRAAGRELEPLPDAQPVENGMGCPGPALFSVFAGAPSAAGELAALPHRRRRHGVARLPGLRLRCRRGRQLGDARSRSSTTAIPTPTGRWSPSSSPTRRCSGCSEQVAFTYADFAMCDRRNAEHFAVVPRDRWTSALIPAAQMACASGARGVGARSRTCWRSMRTMPCTASSSTRG